MTFASPLFLLTLVLVPLVAVFGVFVRRRRARYPISFTNIGVLAGVVQANRHRSLLRWVPAALLFLGLAVAATALAKPEVNTTVAERHAVVVLLVDVSGSMTATDIKPTRLDAAVNAMEVFVNRLPVQSKIGLIAFSTQPQVIALPTIDHASVLAALPYLSPNGATAIGDGLTTAIQVIRASAASDQTGKLPGADGSPGAVVLLSDGAQNRGTVQPLQAALHAKAADIPVYTIAYGTPGAKVSFEGFKEKIPVPPDPRTMDAIARITGARTFTAQTAGQASSIYGHLGSSLAREHQHRALTSWFAVAAMIILVGAALSSRVLGPAL